MPEFVRGSTRINYEIAGDRAGFPVLLLAPGGLRSTADRWRNMPWNPLERLADFHLIAMDQRNAGQSFGPIDAGAGWSMYTADQLALLDHLGVGEFHAVGMCIGGPFAMGLARAAPDRLRAAVMLQPIGLADNRHTFEALFDGWRAEIEDRHPEADEATWAAYRHAMFGGDFMFNTTRAQAAECRVPALVCMGNDIYHPAPISRELAMLLPNARFVEHWKEPEHLEQTDRTIRAFLADHS